MLKEYFPCFAKNTVFLDNAATSQKPQSVIDCFKIPTSAPSIKERKNCLSMTKKLIAKHIGAQDNEIFFVPQGATFASNLLSHELKKQISPGSKIILTALEHHSNIVPWMDIAAQNNCVIEFINFDPKTFLPQLNKTSSFENVSILSVMSSSNVIGGFWKNDFADLKKLIQKARSCGTKVIIDASQTILHSKLNMQSLGADFLFFSPHKSLGPMGLGVLYVSQSNQNLFDNGFGLIESSEKGIAWWENFELENIAYNKIMAVKQSFLFMAEQLDYAKQKKHIANLCSQLISFLEKFSNVVILGNLKQMKISGYIVSFYVKKIASHDIASFLAQEKIAVRAGHHCSQPMHNSLGISSSLRVSFAFYNDVEDVNKFQIAFDSAIKFFNQKGLLCNV